MPRAERADLLGDEADLGLVQLGVHRQRQDASAEPLGLGQLPVIEAYALLLVERHRPGHQDLDALVAQVLHELVASVVHDRVVLEHVTPVGVVVGSHR